MSYPEKMITPRPIGLKLAIKSSLPKAKSLLGLIYAIWKTNGKETEIKYSTPQGIKIVLNEDIKNSLKDYFSSEITNSGMSEEEFFTKLNKNVLLTSQMESLQVALELIWRISLVRFEDETKRFSAERKDQNRYPKKLQYTRNTDFVDLLISTNEDEYKKIIFNWITDKSLTVLENLEEALVKQFTLISEEAVYKVRISDDEDILFLQNGIYSKLADGEEEVNLHDVVERKGSLRILNTVLKENLNYFLKKNGDFAALQDESKREDLIEYNKRVNNYLQLTNIKMDIISEQTSENGEEEKEEAIDEQQIAPRINKPYNRIIFGAPGTGKSYTLNKDRKELGFKFERVTFHPNYSYAHFVGTYKPKPIYKNHEESSRYSKVSYTSEILTSLEETGVKKEDYYPIINEPYITYEFVPGPFLRLLVKALKDKSNNYLLIIEEINRANVAAVFGDIFQLLDRNKEGQSEYAINVSEDIKLYLFKEIGESVEELYLPKNFYIWSTMNVADQGVFPMDTAFKRRWDFEYIKLNDGEVEIEEIRVNIKCLQNEEVNWNIFRKALNKKLIEIGVKEDKLIGPFFIKRENLISKEKFKTAFKNKLLMYIYEDILKHKTNKLFVESAKTFSNLIELYDSGEQIFVDDLISEINQDSTDYDATAE